MRTVIVNHHDSRGRTEYKIYDREEALFADQPNASIAESLEGAQPGQHVLSANGWIVPLLHRVSMSDKWLRGKEKKPRKKQFDYTVFHFPKDRKVYRSDKLSGAIFNYNPSVSGSIASDSIHNRQYELSSRKLYWVQLVKHGVDLMYATQLAFPTDRNHEVRLKALLLNPKLMQLIVEDLDGLKRSLATRGISEEYFAGTIQSILEAESQPIRMKQWALQTLHSILAS
jgi:hypothetical protein